MSPRRKPSEAVSRRVVAAAAAALVRTYDLSLIHNSEHTRH